MPTIQEKIELMVLNQDAKNAIEFTKQHIEKIIKNSYVLKINVELQVGI